MRWHVHGTDAATGEPVVLGVNVADAAHAVQSALAKRILVSRVVRGGGLGLLWRESLRRAVLPLLASAAIVLLPLAATLYYDQRTTWRNLHGTDNEQSHLVFSLREAETLLRISQTRLAELETAAEGHSRQLAGDLEAARHALAERETQLAIARQSVAALETAAAAAAGLKADLDAAGKKLADAQFRIKTLDAQVADQRSRLAALDEARAKAANAEATAARLETQNRALAGQIELLKSQLLELAARPAADPKTAADAPSDPPTVAPATNRPWALCPDYDAASDFAALHFGKDSVRAIASAGGMATITAVIPDNACTFTMKTDRRRVYAATLKVSFAPEAPPEKIVQNTQVLAGFAQTFAPGWKNAVPALAAAMKSLADKDADQQLVLLGDDYKATISNNKLGLYTIRIESPRNTLDDD